MHRLLLSHLLLFLSAMFSNREVVVFFIYALEEVGYDG